MERQSSFGSQGSGKSSATNIVKDAQKHESVESQNAINGFTTALFGVLFTLAKEKFSDSWKIAVLTVVVDFLLILAIMFNMEYPWAVDPHNGIFRFFYMIEIHKPLSAIGYKFYVIVFYLLSAMLYVSVAICVWVAWCFKNDNFPFLWPIKFVRVVVSLFFGMFYIAALNIFLVIMECAPDDGVWYQHVWHVECLTMPHVIHVAFSLLSSLTFAVAALLLVIADHELDPMTRGLLGAPHSMCELKAQLAKTVITVVDVLLWGYPKVQGVTFAICTIATFYFHLKELPFYTSWMNSFRLCFFAVHAWVGLHLGVLVFTVDGKIIKKKSLGLYIWDIKDYTTAQAITNSMLYGLPVVFIGAFLLGAVRLYYFFRVGLRFQAMLQQPNMYSKRIYRFSDDKEVEVCSRIARVWDEDGNLDQQCLDLAETILRAGIQQFPKSPYLHIVYANLLIECRQQLQSGWGQLEEARRMPLNLSYRFSIFTREQEHKQKAAVSSSGESAADLVSYVEFQRNYRMIQSYHKAALAAMREFWRLLLYDAVNMDSLTSAFRKIEQMERLADKTYKMVLDRYPKAVKLLRSYAMFLETVKNDPWTAAQFYSEAEKQEEALENAEHDIAGEEGLTMRNSAIVTINAMGIIQMANKHATKMLGYAKGELEGKNVSCLMPQPFSGRHNSYMRKYVTTGKAKILDSLREVVALHRDRYVFPIKILVTKSQGNGADAIFMGLLKEVDANPNQIKAWLMPNGVTLCADMSFTDYAGWAPNDLIGKPFSAIVADPTIIDQLIERAMNATEEEFKDGALQADIVLTHKYAENVPVMVHVDMGGTSDQRLLVLTMTRVSEVFPTVVFDHHGRVLFANQALCSLLGTKPKDMRGRDIGTLLPQPFGFLHHRWIKDAESSLNKPPPFSCRAGAIHSLVSSNGVHVPVRMVITSREIGGLHVSIVRATRVTMDESLDEQRLNITTDQHGHIISVTAAHHAHSAVVSTSQLDPLGGGYPRPQVFGFAPENLVGRKLYETIDIFKDWHAQGHSVMHAVKALAQHSATQPGSAWRVGVLPQHMSSETEKAAQKLGRSHDGEAQPDDARAGADTGPPALNQQLSQRRTMRRTGTLLRTSMAQWRAAIMQVMGPEHTATGTLYTVKLWRPELLSGVLELNDRMIVIKADTAAGLIFGVPASSMNQQPLSRFLKLGPPGANSGKLNPDGRVSTSGGRSTASAHPLITKESLLGNKHVKGGMKAKVAHKTGPRRVFEARHADGMQLQISFQVALKNGTSNTRVMAAIKPLNLIKGNVAVLLAAMHGEDPDHITVDEFGLQRARTSQLTAQQYAGHAALPSKDQGPGVGLSKELTFAGAADAPKITRQGTIRLAGGTGTGATASAPGRGPSGFSASATGTSPGMASARTLNDQGLPGSGMVDSYKRGVSEQVKHLEEARDSKDKGDEAGLFATQRTEISMMATARQVELDFGADATPRISAVAPAAPADAADNTDGAAPAKLESPPLGPPSPPQPEQPRPPHSSSNSGSANDPVRPAISDDSAMAAQLLDPTAAAAAAAPEGAAKAATQADVPPAREAAQDTSMSGEAQAPGPGGEQGAQHAHHHHHHHHHNRRTMSKQLSRRTVTREWDHVLDVDPEQVPIPYDVEYDIEQHVGSEKDMTVSSSASSYDDDGSDSESDQHVGKNTEGAADKMTREEALQRKKTMAAMEPGEREQYVKGVRRVKEWLASGYYFDRRDAEPIDSKVQHGLAASFGGGENWRGGAARQLSRVDEETPTTRGHAHAHGADNGRANGLNPDDQLVTLDELAAEVEQNGDDVDEGDEDEDEERENAAEAKDAASEDDGNKRKHGGGSHAATAGGGGSTVRVQGGGKSEVSSTGEPSGGESSGISRGRRLKRLLKLLSGEKVSRGVSRLRMHVLIVIACMMVVHAVCFILVIIYIDRQKQFITEISAAGEAIDKTHFTAMYTRSIEAATRGAGFNYSTDIEPLETRLTEDIDRLEYLHQGLYLGFKSLKRGNSAKLNNLWDLKIWNVTEYLDTKVPTYNNSLMTLWNLGNDFISAVREVAYYAANHKLLDRTSVSSNWTGASSPPPVSGVSAAGASAVNVTLSTNRFWLFIRANAGESLYVGYLRVLNTLLLLAQDNISMLKVILISLLLVEGCLVCFAAIGYVFWLLWKATRARAALFTVFLVIPQGQVKALASRHITTAQSDDESDEEKNGAGNNQNNGDRNIGDREEQASDGASVVSAGAANGGGGARRSFTSVGGTEKSGPSAASTRKGITFKEGLAPGKKARRTSVNGSDTVLTRIKRAMSGEVTVPSAEVGGQARRFRTRKRLTHTTSDIKHLAWPFFGWGLLICVIYLVSYLQFADVEESLVNLKMFERSTAQASRTMYYVNELALETDAATQLALQSVVLEEASWLDIVYSTTLYGGNTLSDGSVDGAHDVNTGSLFAREQHATMLFSTRSCFRDAASTCLADDNQYYMVSRRALDPMMRRLMQEARLLGLDDLADVNHTSTRWQYVWQVARQDLHDGLNDMVSMYQSDALAAFSAQGTLHVAVFAISWVLWALYLWLLLKPYLQITSTETKRVAEMLSQLPPELDVEGMVEESWQVVLDTQLDRTQMSVWEQKGQTVTNLATSVFAAVRLASAVAAHRFSNGNVQLPTDAFADDADQNAAAAGYTETPFAPTGRPGSVISDTRSASFFSDKLKAAIKGLPAGKGVDRDSQDGLASDPGFGPKTGSGRRGSGSGWRGSGSGKLPGPVVSAADGPGGARREQRNSGNRVLPLMDSAEAIALVPPVSANGNVGTAKGSSAAEGDNSSRRTSAERRRPSNRVVPTRLASGSWVGPAQGGGAVGDRPRSPMLSFAGTTSGLTPVAENHAVAVAEADWRAAVAEAAAAAPWSTPTVYRNAMVAAKASGDLVTPFPPQMPQQITDGGDVNGQGTLPWLLQSPGSQSRRTGAFSVERHDGNSTALAPGSSGRLDAGMASVVVAAVAPAPAITDPQQVVLPGEAANPILGGLVAEIVSHSGSLRESLRASTPRSPVSAQLVTGIGSPGIRRQSQGGVGTLGSPLRSPYSVPPPERGVLLAGSRSASREGAVVAAIHSSRPNSGLIPAPPSPPPLLLPPTLRSSISDRPGSSSAARPTVPEDRMMEASSLDAVIEAEPSTAVLSPARLGVASGSRVGSPLAPAVVSAPAGSPGVDRRRSLEQAGSGARRFPQQGQALLSPSRLGTPLQAGIASAPVLSNRSSLDAGGTRPGSRFGGGLAPSAAKIALPSAPSGLDRIDSVRKVSFSIPQDKDMPGGRAP